MNELTQVTEFRFKVYPKDFDAERHFYEVVLGYPAVRGWDRGKDDRGVYFNLGGTFLEIVTPAGEHVPLAGCGLSLRVADVWALWQALKDRGNVVFPIRDNAWGDTSFAVRDPEGLEVSFFTETRWPGGA